ncbi:MAG: PD40 domain-containing protein [Acidobacteria bacterium]|nr:PD40 domain-containing protein [Acidobacteriota bacterium]
MPRFSAKLTLLVLALSLGTVAEISAAAPRPATKDAAAKGAKPPDVGANVNRPRADARHVSFTVHEATWTSLDVSPDGKTIVFDLLGDIYRLPIGGGEAQALTRGPAWDSEPRFSPDGTAIAFTSDRGGMENLWVMAADGKDPRPVTAGKDAYVRGPVWTPDGDYLVGRREDGKRAGIPPVELWLYHRHGGGGIKLTSSDDVNDASGPVASRDGRYLYFAARQHHFDYVPDLSGGLWQVWRLDRQTGERLPLTTGFGGAARPALSPDGTRLVFVSRRDAGTVLVERDLATGAERLLARGLDRDQQEGFVGQMDAWPGYAFTPDGSALVFAGGGGLRRLDLATLKSAEIPFTAQVEQWLAPRVAFADRVPTGPVEARILRWTSQSADGRFLAFDAFGRVWLQPLAGGKPAGPPRRLTTDAAGLPPREYAPAFSPDGRSLAYVSWSDKDGGQLWKTALPATPDGPVPFPTRLTRVAGHYANPSWSPDGSRLLLVRGSGLELRGRQPEEEEFFAIEWIASEGGDLHYVASVHLAEAMKFHPQAFWSPGGDRVFFRDPIERKKPTDDPKNDLVSVRLDGTDRKRHLRFPAVSDVVPSPDGRWVAFTSRDNVYVAALPEIVLAEPPEAKLAEGEVPVWRLSDEAGGYVGWADGGRTITWTLGNELHRLPVEAAIRFIEEKMRKELAEKEKAGGKDAAEDKAKSKEKEKEKEPRVPASDAFRIELSVPRPVPRGALVLAGARVITMKGDEVLPEADVLVVGDRIAGVAPAGRLAVPEGAHRVDAKGLTVLPGLIDTHAHLHYSGFELFPETKWEYIANLAYGVTTVYDPSAPSLDVFAQGEMVEAGLMTGPRVYSSGDVLYGGQQEDIFAAVDDQEDARRQVKRMKAYGARMIKVYQQPRRDQRMWLAEACRENHMLMTAEGAGELATDLSMALDGFTAFEHALPVALNDDVVELLTRSETYYTPTLLVAYGGPWGELYYYQEKNPHDDPRLNRFVPHFMLDRLGRRHPWIAPDEYHFPTVARGAAAVVRRGGHVALGAHGQLQGLGVHWELWAMAGEGGAAVPGPGQAMTPAEALRSATLAAADKLGLASDLGSIETGKLADLMIVEGDPLADIHNTARVRWVVKNGVLYDAGTMREEWPENRPLPPFFWRDGAATAP